MSLSDLIFIRSSCLQNFIAFEQPAARLLLRCSRLEIFSIFGFQVLARFILKNIIIDHHIELESILPKFTIRYASLISKYKVNVLYQDEAG